MRSHVAASALLLAGLVFLGGCGEKTTESEPAEVGKVKEVTPAVQEELSQDEPETTIDLPEDPKPGDTFSNPIDGTELVFIPAGEFTMGDDDSQIQKPAHNVEVAGFWLGKCEVTNEQYRKFVKATGHREPGFTGHGDRAWDDDDFNQPKQPVVGVSWNDAVAYCKWAGCRLPTEAEWEYAARGGKQFEYGTSTGKLNDGTDSDANWLAGEEWLFTSPVGSFPPNPFGLHDMSGNVNECCEDHWHDDYDGAPDDGSAWIDKSVSKGADRVYRGGSWGSGAWDLRCAFRNPLEPGNPSDLLGFRLVLAPS